MAASVLNISADHMDRHRTLEAYASAKASGDLPRQRSYGA
ncbi:MAG: Mur ligase family protein [Gammaproteobacteria bacterium]